MKKSAFCIAQDESQVDTIITRLQAEGFSSSDVSVLIADKSGHRTVGHDKSSKAPEGAVTGAGAGGVLGGALGWLVGIGALAIPGLGPFIAAGPILAALSGAAVGAAVGGATGGLIGLGIPEYQAKVYEGRLREGNSLIAVHADSAEELKRAKQIFQDCGAQDISAVGETTVRENDDDDIDLATRRHQPEITTSRAAHVVDPRIPLP